MGHTRVSHSPEMTEGRTEGDDPGKAGERRGVDAVMSRPGLRGRDVKLGWQIALGSSPNRIWSSLGGGPR